MLGFQCVAASVQPIDTESHGVLFMEQGKVMVKEGTVDVELTTSLAPDDDKARINKMVKDYSLACEKAKHKIAWSVDCFMSRVERTAEKALEKITSNECIKANRVKRSDEKHGKLVSIFLYLFWDSSDDETGKASATKHAITDFKKIERKLQETQENYEQEYADSLSKIQEEESKIFASFDTATLQRYIALLREALIDHLESISEAYDSLYSVKFQDTEMNDLRKKANDLTSNAEVPNVSNKELAKMITAEISINEGRYRVTLKIPVIRTEIYSEFFVAPVPEKQKNGIPDFLPHTIRIHAASNTILDNDVELMKINESLSITTRSTVRFSKIDSSRDCAVHTIMDRTNHCTFRRITDEDEMWLDTPAPQVIYFISSKKNDLVCTNSRKPITETAGIITLLPGCYIETPTAIIRGTHDESKMKFANLQFKTPLDVSTPDWKQEMSLNFSSTEKIMLTTASRIDDSNLDADLEELESKDLPWYQTTEGIVMLATVAAFFGTGFGVWIFVKLYTVIKATPTNNMELHQRKGSINSWTQSRPAPGDCENP